MSRKIDVITVDTGVPVPANIRVEYPFRDMRVGDSFQAPLEKRRSVQSTISRLHRITDKEFTVRRTDEKTIRIWRLK